MDIIAQHGQVLLLMALAFSFYACWGIGANDVANAMGPAVGSGAITVRNAIIIAAIFEFAGAFIAGGEVTATIQKGIVDPAAVADRPELLIFGMLGALLGTAVWLMIATWRGWPVSTSHSIVGAVAGFAVAGLGVDAVQWSKMGEIVASWLISPLMGGVFAFVLMISIRQLILNTSNPFQKAKFWGPFYVFLVGWIVTLVSLFKGLKHLNLDFSVTTTFIIATVVGIVAALIGKVFIDRVQLDPTADKEFHFASVEKVFTPMMVFTSVAMAFAHGSNDVANGIGPLAAINDIINSGGKIAAKSSLPVWILVFGGISIVIGLATYGYKVMETIGTKITELTPTRGFSATLAAAIVVVLASRTGMPVSTTHIAVGAVMGVGLARGIGALDLRVLGSIVVSWLMTLPAAALISALTFFMLKGMFG